MAQSLAEQRGFVLSISVPLRRAELVHASAAVNNRSISGELKAALADYFARLEAERDGGDRPHGAVF